MKKIILYSKTFKGFVRLENKMQGKERIGLNIKFTDDILSCTTFENEESKKHFIENFAIGVNYDFETRIIEE